MRRKPIDHALVKLQIQQIRDATYCKVCGAQPIEWHHPEHRDHPRRRVSAMISYHSLSDIIDEIMRCTALCTKCHKKEHTRPNTSRRATYWNKLST